MITLPTCACGASTNMLSLGQQSVNFKYVHCLLLSYFSFCNIYILEIPVTYFREQCATLVSAMLYKLGHALFQADSGVWGVFLPLRFSPHSWLFLVCYAISSKCVAETEVELLLYEYAYCFHTIGYIAGRRDQRTSCLSDLDVWSKMKHQEFLVVSRTSTLPNFAYYYYWHISIICRYWYASIVYLGFYRRYLQLACLRNLLLPVC